MKNFILLLISSFLVSCTTQLKIVTDSDKVYDLSTYKTFSIETLNIKEQPSQISINPILLQRMSRSIEQSLIKRGLKNSSDPDMVVKFFVATEREVERSQSFGSWYRRGYFDDGDQRYYRVDKDAVTIRFHDTKSDEVIWYAFSRFNRSKAPKEQEEVNALIEEAISKFKPAP